MTKRILVCLALSVGLLFGAMSAQAAEESVPLMESGANIRDQASLQRGAKLFMNYCAGCHSLHFMRYSRIAKDLGLTKQQVMENLNFTGGRFHDPVVSAMPIDGAQQWFGKAPPDLSLIVGVRGSDWVYTYLNSFYIDPSRPVGWNNTLLKNAAMPNVLWELQGIQVPVMGLPEGAKEAEAKGKKVKPVVVDLKLAQPGRLTPAQYHQATSDITAFLEYVSEPAALQRRSIAPWVLLYLAAFSFLAWLLKREYWKDVH
ncbi:MAG TPA: cytochrome c1 [Oleiagrimonas sp.]|nr:cytochrome c1 [Oleiagrimonas sp.]